MAKLASSPLLGLSQQWQFYPDSPSSYPARRLTRFFVGERSTGAAAVGSRAGMLGETPSAAPRASHAQAAGRAVWGWLKAFYPFYRMDVLYVTSPMIHTSYSWTCTEGAKSLTRSEDARSSAEVRAPVCCPKALLLLFPFLLPNKPLPGAAKSCDGGKGGWCGGEGGRCGGESRGMESQDLPPAGQCRWERLPAPSSAMRRLLQSYCPFGYAGKLLVIAKPGVFYVEIQAQMDGKKKNEVTDVGLSRPQPHCWPRLPAPAPLLTMLQQ